MRRKDENININRIGLVYQLALWVVFYFVFHHAFFEEFSLGHNRINSIVYTIVFSVYIGLSVFHVKVLMPFLFEKKYKLYGLFFTLSILLVSVILNKFVTLTLDIKPQNPDHKAIGWVAYYAFFGILYVGLGSFFKFYRHWHEMREDVISYEKEKVDAELTALKAQINPHLLFNSLNNIYSLSLDKSDKTPEIILKLSDLMSYVLYDCKKDLVSVKQEVEFINNFIDLEKQRFEDNIAIDLQINIESFDINIAPLVFLPFIENAFKHVGSQNNNKPYINIQLDIADNIAHFKAVNSIHEENKAEKSPYSGIGMQNISKRLLYLYPEQYKLDISESENEFSVDLKIEL